MTSSIRSMVFEGRSFSYLSCDGRIFYCCPIIGTLLRAVETILSTDRQVQCWKQTNQLPVMKVLCVLALAWSGASAFTTTTTSPQVGALALPTTTTAEVSIVNAKLSSTNNKAPTTLTTSLLASTSNTNNDNGEVIINRDFRVAGIFIALGLFLDTLPLLKFTFGPLMTALGVLFLVQAFRLSFVCDDQAFSLQNTVKESGENIIVGGENKWTYDSFVNYDFFPQGWIDQPQGPILVYFKETQTPSDKWMDGPGKSANSDEALANGAVPGQVHFFPAICDCQQLRDEWAKRGCQKL
jgi:hypothetical protein